MAQLTAVLSEFHDDLDRANDLLKLVRTFKAFASSPVPEEVLGGSVAWPEAMSLTEIAPQVRTDLPVMSGSILLYLCGRFENFIREVIMGVADEYVANATVYNDLPESVRGELFARTLEVAKSPTKYNFDSGDVPQMIRVLADSLGPAGQSAVAIETRLLAITDANMHSRMIAEIFKRVGIESIWREAGKQASLKSYMSESEDGRCTSGAIARVDAVMKERNRVAHPTASTTFPDPDQVQETVEFFRVLSRVMVELAQIPR